MRAVPGFANKFTSDLEKIPSRVRDSVNRVGGLDESSLLKLLVFPQDYSVLPFPPSDKDVSSLDDDDDVSGSLAIENGEVAFVILAGGAGTRIGRSKALLKIPEIDVSLLQLKLSQAAGKGPIWIFVSPSNREEIKHHVDSLCIETSRISYIDQYESYRLSADNEIVFRDSSFPDLYPCGHGDVFPALMNSDVLQKFREEGGKYICIVNVDNILASLDKSILGKHIKSNKKVTCEVVRKQPSDKGGVLCETASSLQIVEEFRILGADIQDFVWMNTNSFIIDADVDFSRLGNMWHRVRKVIDNKIVVQHERMLQEITAAYDTMFVAVDREKRFFPVKSLEDLYAVRKIFKD